MQKPLLIFSQIIQCCSAKNKVEDRSVKERYAIAATHDSFDFF